MLCSRLLRKYMIKLACCHSRQPDDEVRQKPALHQDHDDAENGLIHAVNQCAKSHGCSLQRNAEFRRRNAYGNLV